MINLTLQEKKFWYIVELQLRHICGASDSASKAMVRQEKKRIYEYKEDFYREHEYARGPETITFWLYFRLYKRTTKAWHGLYRARQAEDMFFKLSEEIWKIRNMYRLIQIRDLVYGPLVPEKEEDQLHSWRWVKDKGNEIASNTCCEGWGSRLDERQAELLQQLEEGYNNKEGYFPIPESTYLEVKEVISRFAAIERANGVSDK